jgi:hypothetical protein
MLITPCRRRRRLRDRQRRKAEALALLDARLFGAPRAPVYSAAISLSFASERFQAGRAANRAT